MAWLHVLPDSSVLAAGDAVAAVEIWLALRDGSSARVIVRPRSSPEPTGALGMLSDLTFSPDGRTLYFSGAAWTTSAAIHAVDIASGTTRFVTDGNWFEVIPRGRYAGHLLVEQHRYRDEGSFDPVSLIAPTGALVRRLSESEARGNPELTAWRRRNIPPQ